MNMGPSRLPSYLLVLFYLPTAIPNFAANSEGCAERYRDREIPYAIFYHVGRLAASLRPWRGDHARGMSLSAPVSSTKTSHLRSLGRLQAF